MQNADITIEKNSVNQRIVISMPDGQEFVVQVQNSCSHIDIYSTDAPIVIRPKVSNHIRIISSDSSNQNI